MTESHEEFDPMWGKEFPVKVRTDNGVYRDEEETILSISDFGSISFADIIRANKRVILIQDNGNRLVYEAVRPKRSTQ